jgi:hypothetical protein
VNEVGMFSRNTCHIFCKQPELTVIAVILASRKRKAESTLFVTSPDVWKHK